MVWLPDSEKSLKICLLVATEYANVTDGQTGGHTPHESIGRACAWHRAEKTDPHDPHQPCFSEKGSIAPPQGEREDLNAPTESAVPTSL